MSKKSAKKSTKKTSMSKEKKLLEKIEKAKQALGRLQAKRKAEIGKLACKHGLDAFDNIVLEKAFRELAKTLTSTQ